VIADLRHPHLIVMRRTVEGAGFEPELGGGMSLAELSRSEAGWFPLPLRVGLRILLDALNGLAAVHQATQNGKPLDFVHGEVAPSHIFIGRDGFGRLVPVLPSHWNEQVAPNPEVTGYVAPERLLGDVFGQPADVFSAGVLLWEAITGKPLFRNWPLDAIVTQLIGRKVPYPIPFGDALWGVPLADVAMRALSVDPSERWAHVGALGAQVEAIARGHMASSDEIAALVAGFAAGKGHSSMLASDAETIPPPAPTAVTSLSPTASSIQSPSESDSALMAAAEAPAAPEPAPIAERWETHHASAPRIWLPAVENAASESASASLSSGEVADSWSGIAPASVPGISHRTKTLVLAAVGASLAITGLAAYKLLDRGHEARSTATVLAPKVAAPSQPGVRAATAAPKGVVGPTPSTASTAGSEPAGAADSIGKASESSTAAGAAAFPTTAASAPSVIGVAPSTLTRAPRPSTRPAPPPPPPPGLTAAPPRPSPPPPPPAAKPPPKPKEDLFGI
jgi:serine/threonine-protein kinase